MKYAPPGMTQERWELYLKEQQRAAGLDVTFTPEEIAMLQAEAEPINEFMTVEEIGESLG